ncbi:hypothetical protein BDZ89DRAFT_1081525 [Hymenopellis radicata]|nr:hypothetical protein BDZ89DRAFT_1081525 [Hymenopellis radicata]
MLPFIRRRTFNSVVIGQPMNDAYSPDRFQRHLRSSIQNLHSVLNDTPHIHQHIHVFHLKEPKSTAGNPPPFPISRIPILPEFFGHISEMHNLKELVLERINFWMLPDSKALTRALRCASFRLHTLRLVACLMPLDILMSILHAVVDVEILELGPLRFGRFGINAGINYQYHEDPPLIDFDDALVWKEQRKPPATEFLCADSFQMHITSDSDHRFVDLLSSEQYSPLCDIRVLQISKMSGSRNILRRLNKLLARMSQYLEALIIYSAEGPLNSYANRWDDNSIQLQHISTFRFRMLIKYSYERNLQNPLRWVLDPSA